MSTAVLNLSGILNYPSTPSVTYAKDLYKTSVIGTSDCNDYIPYYALYAHELLVLKGIDVKIMEYSLPKASSINTISRNIRYLIDALRSGHSISFNFTIAGTVHRVLVTRGMIMDSTGEILMCVGINKEYVMNTSYADLRTVDASKYVLFISDKINDPIYKNFKKRLEKDVFPIFAEVDTLYTSRINSWLFKNNFKQPKFKSVKESTQHLKEVQKLLTKV